MYTYTKVAAQVNVGDNNINSLAMEVDPVTVTHPTNLLQVDRG